MEWLALFLAILACLCFRWMFPTASRILGWFVLVVSLSLAGYLMYWGFKNARGNEYAGLGAIVVAILVGLFGVTFGSVLVWGNRGVDVLPDVD